MGMSHPSWHYPCLIPKILPILTYGSITWNVDTGCNAIIDGIPETPKTARMEIQYLYNHVFNKTFPDGVSIQRIGKNRNDQQTRPILIKFRYIKDKDAFLGYLHDNKDKCKGYYPINLDDKCVQDTDIERLHYKYCKFSLNIPKESSTLVTLTELGRFPIRLNIWTQMIKYLMRFLSGTNNSILDEAFQSAKLNETRWYQSIHTLIYIAH